QDALTGRTGSLFVTLGIPGEIRDVLLAEQTLGTVEGAVIAGLGTGPRPAGSVRISFRDGVTPERTVTTDPAGRFSFAGVAAADFTLVAENPANHQIASASATLPENVARAEIDLVFPALTSASVLVLAPDGIVPADAAVTLKGVAFEQNADTDAAGRVGCDAGPARPH